MSCCNPGYCCCTTNVSVIPSGVGLPGHASNLWCTIMSDTVGVLWRAKNGTVDPWTKNNIIACNAAGLVKASGGQLTTAQAIVSACQQVTTQLKSNGACPCCDPKCCLFKKLFSDLESSVIWIAILGVIAIILMNKFSRVGQ